MNLHNLATVFGPTLLRPAPLDEPKEAADLFSIGAREAIIQTSILYYFMEVMSQKKQLT